MLDGVPANQFDQVPGQDLSRQVVLVHNGRLYTLTFTPMIPRLAMPTPRCKPYMRQSWIPSASSGNRKTQPVVKYPLLMVNNPA